MKNVDRSETIMNAIRQNPGISLSNLMKKTGMKTGTIIHHLTNLEERGMIKSQKATKHRRYYDVGVSEEEFPIIRNIRKPTKKQILFQIIVEGNPSFKQLTLKIKKSPSTISWNLSELINEGIIEKCVRNEKELYRVKDISLLKKTFQKEFARLFEQKDGHPEDIFLAI